MKNLADVMSKLIKILSIVNVLLTICDADGVRDKPVPDCVTPDHALGSCVDVHYCVTIMTALINGDDRRNPAVSQFLRESQCGIEFRSHKVCCHITSIDFGASPTENVNYPSSVSEIPITTTTTHAPVFNPPPIQSPPLLPSPPTHNQRQPVISDFEKCGKLEQYEAPTKWIAEVWYKHNKLGRNVYESKCLGTVITMKHVIVPAHCVASLPVQTTLDHLTIENDDYYPSKIFVHASYNQPKFAHDIAIIELDIALSQSQNPKATAPQQINNAICLDGLDAQQDKSNVAFMKTEQNPLRDTIIELIPNNRCTMFFDQQFTNLTSSQFCGKVQSNDANTSPFIGAIMMSYDNVNRQYSLKGFTATVVRTEQSFDESKPFIFTDVRQYMIWIKAALSEISSYQNEVSTETNDRDKSNGFSRLNGCQLNGESGRCVVKESCLYENMKKSPEQIEFLKSIKCSTGSNKFYENGVCCPEKSINQSALDVYDFDIRFDGKTGIELLDLEKCGLVDFSKRIVGGSEAGLKEFPWYALIKYKYRNEYIFKCGGSVISSRYVLTCAHCLTEPSYEVIGARLGEYDMRTNPDCKYIDHDKTKVDYCNPPVIDIEYDELIIHPNYDNPRYHHDIGLMRLITEIKFDREGIIPICLPVDNFLQQNISNKSTVAGFGLTEHSRDSDVILKILVPRVSSEKCQAKFNRMIQLSDKQICFGGEGTVDSCKGDSGSPLLNYALVNYQLKAVQTGIVASGHGNCGRGVTGYPGIYTDVSKYMDWILKNMRGD